MPKSRRDKKISLTRTKKKGLEQKQKLIEDIQDCVDKYARVFTFSVENMRNIQLKVIRDEWKHSRFFFGKNKVMALALGKTAESEYRDNLHLINKYLRGQTGLLFTNKTKKDVLEYFNSYVVDDYARSGTEANQTVILEEGPLSDFTHSMEPQLRQLGLPTSLQKGVIHLLTEHKVCDQGKPLTPEQSRILKLFGYKMSQFRVTVESVWNNNGKFEKLEEKADIFTPTKVRVKPKKSSIEDEMVECLEEDEVSDDDDIEEDDDEEADDDDDSEEDNG